MKKIRIIVFLFLCIFSFSSIKANEIDIPEEREEENEYIVYPDDVSNEVQGTTISNINGSRVKMTPDFEGPCVITYGESITINESWSLTLSASVKSFIISKLEAGLGFTLNRSAETGTSYSGAFSVDEGYIGAVYFTPYLYKIDCIYIDPLSHGYRVTVKTPKKANVFCDGLYQRIQRLR